LGGRRKKKREKGNTLRPRHSSYTHSKKSFGMDWDAEKHFPEETNRKKKSILGRGGNGPPGLRKREKQKNEVIGTCKGTTMNAPVERVWKGGRGRRGGRGRETTVEGGATCKGYVVGKKKNANSIPTKKKQSLKRGKKASQRKGLFCRGRTRPGGAKGSSHDGRRAFVQDRGFKRGKEDKG